MRGISEKRLKAILHNQVLTPKTQSFIQYLIDDECQELQEHWMTIDEFLKSGFVGECCIFQGIVSKSFFNGKEFTLSDGSLYEHPISYITHVQSVHKPEPPR